MPVERVQAAQALLADAQRRENDAVEELKSAQQRIADLERELGQAQGRLQAHYRAPEWWRRIFGGAGE